MTKSAGITRMRQLIAQRKRLNIEIDAVLECLLRDGEFVGDIADAMEVSREKIRRERKDRNIPDAREIRRVNGSPLRHSPTGS